MNTKDQRLLTPALVFNESTLVARSRRLSEISHTAGARLLFALKSLAFASVLDTIKPFLDGFACSSLFEATLARHLASESRHSVHLTTPGLRPDELEELADLCHYMSFNSLGQWQRCRAVANRRVSCGLRVNPQVSFVPDERYNPCRNGSKLGVPLEELIAVLRDDPHRLDGIQGLHLHNNCDSNDLTQLLATIQHVQKAIPAFFDRLEWINLGGGYLFADDDDLTPFSEAVRIARGRTGRTVFIEPGAAIARQSGRLVSSLVDLFTSDGKTVAVLDTTVNHMPELFEYQCEPEVEEAVEGGPFRYTLVGSSCLAGDLFGEHAFAGPLEVGSRIEFANAGTYALAKAHMFNGINLPTIYTVKSNGELVVTRRFTYEDFASRNGVVPHALV